MIITTASGFAGEIRRLKIRELQRLADPNMQRNGRALDVLLSVMSGVTDLGPYAKRFKIGTPPNWDDVLVGDRFCALIDIRAASWGGEYEFRVPCSECREAIEWEMDLRQLPRKAFPEETLMQLKEDKNEFLTEGPAGERITFKLLNGADEKAIEAHRRRNAGRFGVADALRARIQAVAGVPSLKLMNWIEDLDAQDAMEVVRRMDLVDGGVETDIEIQCTFCNWQQMIRLPFGKSFYLPTKKKKGTEMGAPPMSPETTGFSSELNETG